jgi:hypothetical protein
MPTIRAPGDLDTQIDTQCGKARPAGVDVTSEDAVAVRSQLCSSREHRMVSKCENHYEAKHDR